MEGGQAEQGRHEVSCCVPSLLPPPLLTTACPFFFFFEGGFQKQPEPGKSLARRLLSERQGRDGKVRKELMARGGQRPKPPAAHRRGKEGENGSMLKALGEFCSLQQGCAGRVFPAEL